MPIRWCRAGDDRSRPNHADQCPGRPLMSSQALSTCPAHAPDLPCPRICTPHPGSVAATVEAGPSIKSP